MPCSPACVVYLSARTRGSLSAVAVLASRRLAEEVEPREAPRWFAHGEGPHRAVIVGADRAAPGEGLRGLARGDPHPGVVTGAVGARSPRVGLLLTGEGSERAGAGAALVAADPAFAQALRGALEGVGRSDLASMQADLRQWRDLRLGKVLLGALNLGLAAALRAAGVLPAAVCGHSVGEYVAAALAGSLSEQDAMRLLDDLGRRLADSSLRGGLVLVGGPIARVQALLAGLDEVGLAVDNADDWCALWGTPVGLERARERLRSAGLPTRGIPVSQPMHGPLVIALADEVAEFARSIPHAQPARPWVSTVTAALVSAVEARHWGQAMTRPVRFREAWAVARALPVDLWVELGPKPSLSLFVEEGAPVLAALDPRLDDRLAFARLLGWLWCGGVAHAAVPAQAEALSEVDLAEAAALLATLEPAVRPGLQADIRTFEAVIARVRAEAAAVLGVGDPEEVAVDQPLVAMGLDSLMAVDLRNRLSLYRGLRPTLSALLGDASVETIARGALGPGA